MTVFHCGMTVLCWSQPLVAGVLATTAFDANTGLSVGGSNALLGVFGAMITYSALNIEPDWNRNGFTVRLLYMVRRCKLKPDLKRAFIARH